MGLLDGLLGGVPSLLGGIIGGSEQASAQASANAANERINKENIAFQTDMSNTAVQRRSADMVKAGINPILAAGSAASQPSYSPIPMQSTKQGFGQLGSAVGSDVTSAFNASRLTSAQARNLEAQADLTEAQTPGAKVTSANAADRQHWEIEDIRKSIEQRISSFELNDEQRRQIHSMIPFLVEQAQAGIENTAQQTSASKTAQQLQTYQLPSAKAEADVWQKIGAAGRGANIGANALQQAIAIVKSLMH